MKNTPEQTLMKLIEEQQKQIDSMKKAISVLQNRLIKVTQKTERSYHTGRKNTNDINNINNTLQRNR